MIRNDAHFENARFLACRALAVSHSAFSLSRSFATWRRRFHRLHANPVLYSRNLAVAAAIVVATTLRYGDGDGDGDGDDVAADKAVRSACASRAAVAAATATAAQRRRRRTKKRARRVANAKIERRDASRLTAGRRRTTVALVRSFARPLVA